MLSIDLNRFLDQIPYNIYKIDSTNIDWGKRLKSKRNKQLSELRRQMIEYFSKDELVLVAYEFGVNWDVLPGDTLAIKAHSLILQADRTDRLNELLAILSSERPNIIWEEIVGKRDVLAPADEDKVRTAVWNALYRSLWKQRTFLNSHKGRPPLIEKFSIALWADYLNKPIDSRPNEPELILEEIRSHFFDCPDDKFYTYLEFILNFWNDLNHYSPEPINRAVNLALKKEEAGLQYEPTYQFQRFQNGAIIADDKS